MSELTDWKTVVSRDLYVRREWCTSARGLAAIDSVKLVRYIRIAINSFSRYRFNDIDAPDASSSTRVSIMVDDFLAISILSPKDLLKETNRW